MLEALAQADVAAVAVIAEREPDGLPVSDGLAHALGVDVLELERERDGEPEGDGVAAPDELAESRALLVADDEPDALCDASDAEAVVLRDAFADGVTLSVPAPVADCVALAEALSVGAMTEADATALGLGLARPLRERDGDGVLLGVPERDAGNDGEPLALTDADGELEAASEGVAFAVDDPLADARRVGDALFVSVIVDVLDADTDGERDCDGDAVGDAERAGEGDEDPDAEALPDAEPVRTGDGVGLDDAGEVGVVEALAEPDSLAVGVEDTHAENVANERVALDDKLGEGDSEGDRDESGEPLTVAPTDDVSDPKPDAEALADGDGVAEPLADGAKLVLALADEVEDAVGDIGTVGAADQQYVAERLGVALVDAQPDADVLGEPVGDSLALAVPGADADTVDVSEPDRSGDCEVDAVAVKDTLVDAELLDVALSDGKALSLALSVGDTDEDTDALPAASDAVGDELAGALRDVDADAEPPAVVGVAVELCDTVAELFCDAEPVPVAPSCGEALTLGVVLPEGEADARPDDDGVAGDDADGAPAVAESNGVPDALADAGVDGDGATDAVAATLGDPLPDVLGVVDAHTDTVDVALCVTMLGVPVLVADPPPERVAEGVGLCESDAPPLALTVEEVLGDAPIVAVAQPDEDTKTVPVAAPVVDAVPVAAALADSRAVAEADAE